MNPNSPILTERPHSYPPVSRQILNAIWTLTLTAWRPLKLLAILTFISFSAHAELVGFYEMEGNGNDSAPSGGAQNLTISGDAATFDTPGHGGTQHKITLGGSDDYGINTTNFTANAPGITLTGWFSTTSTGPQSIAFLRIAGANFPHQSAATVEINASGNLVGGGRSIPGDAFQYVTGPTIAPNTLYFCAVALNYADDSISLHLYNNETDTWSITSGTVSFNDASLIGNNALFVGIRGDLTQDFVGSIDELRVYDESLSEQQLLALMPITTRVVQKSASTQDIVMRKDYSTRWVGESGSRVGVSDGTGLASSHIIPIQLPVLDPGETVLSASLRVNLEGWSNWNALSNIDLYGVWITNTSAAANIPDYFVDGSNPAAFPMATKLQDELAVPADLASGPTGNGQVIPKVSGEIGDFFQALYDGGAVGGEYAFLTLTHDAPMTAQRYYTFTAADSPNLPTPYVEFILGSVEVPPAAEIVPSESWSGISGSGFTAQQPAPVDPQRLTAKPALRLATPPHQYFTERMPVYVSAAANDSGSLFDDLGLSHVRVHCEGNTIDIPSPSYRMVTDANGVERSYYGWHFDLVHPEAGGTDGNGNGNMQIYFEAVPTDSTMQNRVIGPYRWTAARFDDGQGGFTPYDHRIEVAPSNPDPNATPKRFASVGAATTYCKNVNARNPLVTITESRNDYFLGGGQTFVPDGRFNITASVPVTFGRNGYISDAAAKERPVRNLHIFGSNITMDMRWWCNIYTENDATTGHWMDGISFIHSGPSGELWRGGNRPVYPIIRQHYSYSPVLHRVHHHGRSRSLPRRGSGPWLHLCGLRRRHRLRNAAGDQHPGRKLHDLRPLDALRHALDHLHRPRRAGDHRKGRRQCLHRA